ncbi:molybdopterin-dependent oxidoreductase, partial [Myxococcota bacterium]|nr:molybdopterin-dependent oxidoreductase [Myxococcota bacterium]
MSSAGPKMDTLAVSFVLNGAPAAVEVNPKRPALDVLREDLDQRSLKAGCSPQGICGCCVALVDGKVRLTCTLPVRSLQGKEVRTLDGLSEATRAALGQAFAQTGAAQCGYCTPGIAAQAAALLERAPDPSEEEVKKALNMHLCRCTGWGRIVEAVRLAGALRRGEAAASTDAPPRLDAAEMTLGQHPYVDDLCPPGLVFAAPVFAPLAVGTLTAVDVAEAAESQGVIAVWTAEALPEGGLVGVGEALRACGDLVALVIADTKERAGLAAERVKVNVEARAAVTDLQAAAKDPTRLGPVAKLQRGALNTRLNEGGLTLVKETYTTQAVDPAFLEPEAVLAQPTFGGGLTLFTCDAAPGEEAARVQAALGLAAPPKVVSMPTGGAFGAKSGLPLGVLAAAAARRLGRPVKLALALEDGARLHPKSPAMSLRVMLAADAEGHLVGLKARALVDLGGRPINAEALIHAVAEHMTGAYRVPHVEVEVQGVLTDNPSAGPVRGAGLTGACFAVEGAIDQLAAKLGLDALTLRSRSALRAGDAFGDGVLADDPGVEAVLTALAPRVVAARAEGHKVGVALAVARRDGRPARVRLEPRDDGLVSLRVNVGEGGQGLHAALVAAAAAASGRSPAAFEVIADLPGASAGE